MRTQGRQGLATANQEEGSSNIKHIAHYPVLGFLSVKTKEIHVYIFFQDTRLIIFCHSNWSYVIRFIVRTNILKAIFFLYLTKGIFNISSDVRQKATQHSERSLILCRIYLNVSDLPNELVINQHACVCEKK